MFQIESLWNNVGGSSHYRIRVIRHRIDQRDIFFKDIVVTLERVVIIYNVYIEHGVRFET